MNFNEEVFTDPEPVSWQSRLAARRRKKEANQFNEQEGQPLKEEEGKWD